MNMKQRLAELGRGAGEPVAIVHTFSDGKIGRILDRFQGLPEGTKLYTRPPVAGLAELTDSDYEAAFYELCNHGILNDRVRIYDEDIEAIKSAIKVAFDKAAREFLGKVDG